MGDVIGIHDRQLCRFGQAGSSHQGNVHPGDRQDAGTAFRRRGHSPYSGGGGKTVTGQVGGQMLCHTGGADPGASSSVGDGKGFVEIEMANIGTDVTGAAQAHLSIHVGTVHVNLASLPVHEAADFPDAFLEDAVGGRIGDHQRPQGVLVLRGFCRHVFQIDIAHFIAFHGHHLEARHDRTGRIGAMRRGGNETNVAFRLTPGHLPATDRQKAGVFPLASGIGLERDSGKSGDFGEPSFQLGDHGGIAGGLRWRGKGVQASHGLPAQRHHGCGGIELHGARSEGDHAPIQCQILSLQTAQEPQHFVLGVVPVENFLGQKGGGPH